jgi:MFS family permease
MKAIWRWLHPTPILCRLHEPQLDEATEAYVDGDVAITPGTARAALAHRDFRVVWLGALSSSVGTWMQNVVLSAFAFELTKSPTFVGIVYFAGLGPSLLIAVVGGVMADVFDRRKLLIIANFEQLVFSALLAWFARGADPSKEAIVLCVAMVGVGQAFNGPTYSSLLPELVGRRDLAGAVSLQSTQMNVARVIGPAIGGVLSPLVGAAWVFFFNALTYQFAVVSVVIITLAPRVTPVTDVQGWRRLVSGFVIAKRDALVRRILVTMSLFSFFSLTFIGLMPVLAADNLGMRPKSLAYGLLYASFGTGAAVGAVSIGTFLAGASKPRIVQRGMAAFAVLLGVFAVERIDLLAYPTIVLLGFVYFAAVTSLSTVLQEHLEDHVRGRVMALWMMSFGGMVPLGTLALSPVADHLSVTFVALVGAVVAGALAWYADLRAVGAPG